MADCPGRFDAFSDGVMNHTFLSKLRQGSLLAAACGLFLCGFASPAARAADLDDIDTVVHLSHFSDDLHAVFMALKVATMVREKGDDVALFVDLEGARLADRRLPAGMRWGTSDLTVGELFDAFIKAGGTVQVCPHCAQAAGITADDLRTGASILTADELATMLAAADKVIDY